MSCKCPIYVLWMNIQFSVDRKGGGGQQRRREAEGRSGDAIHYADARTKLSPTSESSWRKYQEKIFWVFKKKYSVINLYSEKLATKQTLWEEKMADVTVTFWLEGVLLPIISAFGLIGEANLMTKIKKFPSSFTFAWVLILKRCIFGAKTWS